MVDSHPTDCVYNGYDQTWIPTNVQVLSSQDGDEIPEDLYEVSISYNKADRTNVTRTIAVNIEVVPKISGVTIEMNPTTRSYQITPATITVEIKDQTKAQGAADPPLTSKFTGAVKDEIPGWTGQIKRDPGEAIGTYAIIQGDLELADGENGFFASNYTLVVIPGLFFITAAVPGGDGGDYTPTP